MLAATKYTLTELTQHPDKILSGKREILNYNRKAQLIGFEKNYKTHFEGTYCIMYNNHNNYHATQLTAHDIFLKLCLNENIIGILYCINHLVMKYFMNGQILSQELPHSRMFFF